MAQIADPRRTSIWFVDGVYLKRSLGGEVQNVSVLVTAGVNKEGNREILGVAEVSREGGEP